MTTVNLTINGEAVSQQVSPRDSLVDFLRDGRNLTGTHVGCEHGACGACTVTLDGIVVRSCLVLAVMCEGRSVETIEGTRNTDPMDVIRRHFHEKHAVQCGFCTPGMLMMARDIIARHADPSEASIRSQLSGQICRCTGYAGIVAAIGSAAMEIREGSTAILPKDIPSVSSP
jgi:carbon-monoxide dehydrogenase small subunit